MFGRRNSGWRVSSVVLWAVVALAGMLGLLVATPFALSAIAPAGYDWNKLSDISQVYAAVSILISSAALAGVVLSLVFQLRQARTSDEQAVRDSHLQLTSLVFDDPELLRAWSPPAEPVTLLRHQQHIVSSLALGELLHRFRIGHLSTAKLTVKLDSHFRHEIAREQWQRDGSSWLRTMKAGDRRDSAFVRLTQERYAAAVSAGPPAADVFLPSPAARRNDADPRHVSRARPRPLPSPRTAHALLGRRQSRPRT
ncbi:hypothetical protein FCH28_12845 [Streptomyces piniterrae]|uniref:Uncharacterized protein n=1 Tax=Streptomyces piniterrae TaxID=2571125 RepID=A0A4U0NIK2_9ACTN|nr:DUF6082 family protein [Streptomyces piniterrae]TJZ54089.1 hypothetical protein FCH28_12845 [Streptomyces piniterrae]